MSQSLAARNGIGALLLAVTLTGCADKSADSNPASARNEFSKEASPGGAAAGSAGPIAANQSLKAPAGPETAQTRSQPNAPSASLTPPAPDRYLIRNANLVIEVKDARVANDRLIAQVRAAGGYVSNLQENVDALGARTVTMQVRVPAKLFDSSMQELASLGKVMEKKVSAEDVTEEYVDTESTLRNFRKTEARLLDHLSRTGRLSDTLLIEKELTRVRQEIEQREGRLRFLAHRVEFSTIDLTLREEARSQATVPPESYSTGKEAATASRSLIEFLRSLWTMAIWVGIWAVVWLPLALLGFWIIRTALRQRPRPGPTSAPPPFFIPDEPASPPSERTGMR